VNKISINEEVSIISITEFSNPQKILNYYEKNKSHLSSSMPKLPDDFYSEEFWCNRLSNFKNEQGKAAYRYLIESKGNVVGHIFVDNVIRGSLQAGYLGYALAKGYEGKGLMRVSLQNVIEYLFNHENLNRIMANCMPSNIRSIRVLQSLGFELEGMAKRYLKIQGKWEDHYLFS